MDEKWPVKFGFIGASRNVQVYPLGQLPENIFVYSHVFDRFHQVLTNFFNHLILSL